MERRDGEKKRSAALGPGLAARDPPPPPGRWPHLSAAASYVVSRDGGRAALHSYAAEAGSGAGNGNGSAGLGGTWSCGARGDGGCGGHGTRCPGDLMPSPPGNRTAGPLLRCRGGGGTARPTARCWESRGGGGRAVCACSAGRGGTLRRDGDSVGHGDSAQRWGQCATWGQRAEMGTPSPAARRAARDVRPGRGAQCGCAQSPPCHHSTLCPTRRSPAVLSPRAVAARNYACEG